MTTISFPDQLNSTQPEGRLRIVGRSSLGSTTSITARSFGLRQTVRTVTDSFSSLTER
jgi:hypothetical protein